MLCLQYLQPLQYLEACAGWEFLAHQFLNWWPAYRYLNDRWQQVKGSSSSWFHAWVEADLSLCLT